MPCPLSCRGKCRVKLGTMKKTGESKGNKGENWFSLNIPRRRKEVAGVESKARASGVMQKKGTTQKRAYHGNKARICFERFTDRQQVFSGMNRAAE